MTKSIIKTAAIVFFMISSAYASNMKDHMKSSTLTIKHMGFKFAHKTLSNTRPAIRMLNVAVPVDMSGFKATATKWSQKMDAKVMKNDKLVLAAKKAISAKIVSQNSDKKDGAVMTRSLTTKVSSNDPFDIDNFI